jgi:hypothetical protein
MVADELRRQADTFIDLYDLQPKIERQGGGDSRRPVEQTGSNVEADTDGGDFDDYDEVYEAETA